MSSDPKTSADSKASSPGKPGAKAKASGREERLAQALRDNLKKRKAQQRQRREGDPPAREPSEEGPA